MNGEHGLDTCGCCTPAGNRTPSTVFNAPGRPELRRRVGTATSFNATMAAGLTRQEALTNFTNRQPDDPAIALVDAWSVVLDVLTFYSERIANEGYLRTSEEPLSLTELAHSVSYTPTRGRAAAALLSFTLEDAPGAPALTRVPAETKVASLPAPGEVPQHYETTVDIDARPRWNAIRARSRSTQELVCGATTAYVDGLRTDLAVGDAVLLTDNKGGLEESSEDWAFRPLSAVELLPAENVTRLRWTHPLGSPVVGSGRKGREGVPDPIDARLYVLRRKAAVFGAAAPDYRLIDASVTGFAAMTARMKIKGRIGPLDEFLQPPGSDWPGWRVQSPEVAGAIDLDAVYPSAVADSWAVLLKPGTTARFRIGSASEASRTDYTLNAKVSRLTLVGPDIDELFGASVRETSAWVGSEPLALASSPVTLPVQGDQIDLAVAIPTLEAGRTVVIQGPRPVLRVAEGVHDLELSSSAESPVTLHPGDELEVIGPVVQNATGSVTWETARGTVTATPEQAALVTVRDDAPSHSEVAVVADPTPVESEVDSIRLTGALTGCYDATAVRIAANIAPATHGETRSQVLGSGDATQAYQRFTLAQAPLTYVAAQTGGAIVSTLEVRVDGRTWTEVPRLFGTRPDDEVFTTRMSDDGEVTIKFGDGATGARLPTGTNNVSATYRVGTGVAGRVGADQLSLLMSRPLGVRSVTNPLAAGLAADIEEPEAVRSNAARTALTLERVVSLRDVEDFARSVPGIDKARANWLWDGRVRLVHLTVAGTGGQIVDDQALADLDAELRSVSDARLPLVVASADVVSVYVTASLVVAADFDAADVRDAVASEVTTALSVDARSLGQPLTAGDVILAAHRVAGVEAVNVTVPPGDVSSFRARMRGSTPMPAQLVVLAPGGLTLTEVSS